MGFAVAHCTDVVDKWYSMQQKPGRVTCSVSSQLHVKQATLEVYVIDVILLWS